MQHSMLSLQKRQTRRHVPKARSFLRYYPQSAFLAQAYELAARAGFDIGNNKAGLEFAQRSFELLPENPLFQINVADVEARDRQNEAAIRNAKNALENIERFELT